MQPVCPVCACMHMLERILYILSSACFLALSIVCRSSSEAARGPDMFTRLWFGPREAREVKLLLKQCTESILLL